MSGPALLGTLATKIVALHESLDAVGIRHQFGGAIALAWYRNPRATTDIDVNLTVPPAAADAALFTVSGLGVTVSSHDRTIIQKDGQARLDWGGSYLDMFFATLDLHHEMATHARTVQFGPVEIPILCPEHLIVCKAIFDRPKDWLDIEEMVRWGTEIDVPEALRWVADILGSDAEQHTHLTSTLAALH